MFPFLFSYSALLEKRHGDRIDKHFVFALVMLRRQTMGRITLIDCSRKIVSTALVFRIRICTCP